MTVFEPKYRVEYANRNTGAVKTRIHDSFREIEDQIIEWYSAEEGVTSEQVAKGRSTISDGIENARKNALNYFDSLPESTESFQEMEKMWNSHQQEIEKKLGPDSVLPFGLVVPVLTVIVLGLFIGAAIYLARRPTTRPTAPDGGPLKYLP
jgi:hypothetical protein